MNPFKVRSKLDVGIRLRPTTEDDTPGWLQAQRDREGVWTLSTVTSSADMLTCHPTHVYVEGSTNAAVYANQGRQLVEAARQGQNALLAVYGQTGSGKTRTVCGAPGEEQGLLELMIEDMMKDGQVTMKICEVYNDKAYLHSMNGNTQLIRTPKELTATMLTSHEQATEALQQVSAKRRTSTTKGNIQSSRSHLVVFLGWAGNAPGQVAVVDMAGSESYDHAASKQVQDETCAIHTTILYFKMAIEAGGPPQDTFTRFLDPWLRSTDARISLLVTLRQEAAHIKTSRESLKFAEKAMKSQVLVRSKFQDPQPTPLSREAREQLASMQREVEASRIEVKFMKEKLEAAQRAYKELRRSLSTSVVAQEYKAEIQVLEQRVVLLEEELVSVLQAGQQERDDLVQEQQEMLLGVLAASAFQQATTSADSEAMVLGILAACTLREKTADAEVQQAWDEIEQLRSKLVAARKVHQHAEAQLVREKVVSRDVSSRLQVRDQDYDDSRRKVVDLNKQMAAMKVQLESAVQTIEQQEQKMQLMKSKEEMLEEMLAVALSEKQQLMQHVQGQAAELAQAEAEKQRLEQQLYRHEDVVVNLQMQHIKLTKSMTMQQPAPVVQGVVGSAELAEQ